MGLITLSRNFIYWTQSWTVLAIIAGRKGFLWRSLWNVVFVGTLAAFTLQSVQLIQEYLQYQKTTNIQLFYEPQASFPAVTVCNLNPFKASKVNESEALQTLLNAYSFVMQKKQQAQAGAVSSGGLEIGKRRRRQADGEGTTIDCPVTPETDSTSGYSYERYDCTNGTSVLRFLVCPDTDPRPYDSQWYAPSDLDALQTDLAKAFYQCLESDVCNGVQCSKYTSGMDMLSKLQDCAVAKVGLSPYPPAAGSINIMATLAETVATKCGFADGGCHLGTYEKPPSTYPGNYIYKACPADSTNSTYTLTISIDSCNNGTPINNTHDYNESACKYPTYIDAMAQKVSSALEASQCFTNCTAPCTYSETDTCQAANYQDLLCQIQTGNGTCTTSTSFWTTTPLETTVLSTTTDPPTTTTADASTSMLQTTDITTTTSADTSTVEPTTTSEASTVGSSTTQGQTTTSTESTTPLLASTSTLSSLASTLSSSTPVETTSTMPATSSTTDMLTSTTTEVSSNTPQSSSTSTPETSSTSSSATTTTEISTSSSSIAPTTSSAGQSSSASTSDVTSTTTMSTTSSMSTAGTTAEALTTSTAATSTTRETTTTVASTPDETSLASSTLAPSTTTTTPEPTSSTQTATTSEKIESTTSTPKSSAPTSASATASTSTTYQSTEKITSQSSRMSSLTTLQSTSTTTTSSSTVDATATAKDTSFSASSGQHSMPTFSTTEVPETPTIPATTDAMQSRSTKGAPTTSSADAPASSSSGSSQNTTSSASQEAVSYSTNAVGPDATERRNSGEQHDFSEERISVLPHDEAGKDATRIYCVSGSFFFFVTTKCELETVFHALFRSRIECYDTIYEACFR
ncbi:hypothetical protein AAVH_09228 [Aphelenchoides avenae]|nr:hypothetical protein AAVH_09228 [Aphelenchus avenae]